MNTTNIIKPLTKHARFFAAAIWLLTGCREVAAQPAEGRNMDSLIMAYPFIKADSNYIQNDSLALNDFYRKLYELKQGKRQRVTVVHIGDSHIQADFFTGQTRQQLQRQFGNAGRGTLFPYRALKTNGPPDYHTYSAGKWTSKRNIMPDQPMDIGLCGITLETTDSSSFIDIQVDDLPGLDYGFNKLTVFNDGDDRSYLIAVCDEYNCEIGNAVASDPKYPFARVQQFGKPMHHIVLDFSARDTTDSLAHIYGLYLEKNDPGIMYNMVGVNGAMARHYNLSSKFMEQLAYLNPDLVVVSLGTNEAYRPGFREEDFRRQMDSLISNVRRNCPNTAVMLTTPGDSFRRTRQGRVKNPDMLKSRNAVIDIARKNNCAYWDLFNVMGGYGSMAKWYASGMAAYDRLHFSRKGYEIQGELLYRAYIRGYDKYVQRRNGK